MSEMTLARIEVGLKLDEAARQLGIPAGYLSEIENGKRSVSPDRASQIANLYRKPQEKLFSPTRFALREPDQPNSA